jgi:hypothetical protein
MGLQYYTQDMIKIQNTIRIQHKCVVLHKVYTHPTLICRGTDGRTDGWTDKYLLNIQGFRDKLLLRGENVFDESMHDPKNKPSYEPKCEPTNDQMANDQTTNQRLEWDAELPNILSPKQGKYSLSHKQDAELPSKITISITQITSNTSYTFEAVIDVNHDHDKIKVDNRVTFEDNRDDEIQCGSREQSNTQPSDWQGAKQRSLVTSACVHFTTFRSNLSSGLVYC